MKRIGIATIYICLLSILSIACSEDQIGDDERGNITGTVVSDGDNTPVENVRISTQPVTTTVFTDEMGNFIIENIPVGEYSVEGRKDGFLPSFEAASVFSGNVSNIVLELLASDSQNRPPTAPELIAPEEDGIVSSTEVTFTWQSSDPDDDTIIYALKLRNDANNSVLLYENIADTTLVVTGLVRGRKYFWQVSASDDINEPVNSEIATFNIEMTPDDNPFLFVKQVDGNNVIFSGNQDDLNTTGETDVDVIQLTSASTNSFRPRKNNAVNKIAFLRTIGSETHLFTMDFDGTNVLQVSNSVPLAGFRLSEIRYTWANNGGALVYPNFDKLYSVDPDGGATTIIYQTTDGSLISEIAIPDFDQDLLLIKTNNSSGYDVRIYTYRLSTASEEVVLIENMPGAIGGIDITANGERVLYSLDRLGSENPEYRRFDSRIYLYKFTSGVAALIDTDVVPGEVEYDPVFSPSEGGMIWTRRGSNLNSVPDIFQKVLTEDVDKKLFTNSIMPDWE